MSVAAAPDDWETYLWGEETFPSCQQHRVADFSVTWRRGQGRMKGERGKCTCNG